MSILSIRQRLLYLLLCLCLTVFGQSPNQGPYHFSLKRDAPYMLAGAGSVLGGYLLEQQTDEVTLGSLNLSRPNWIDRGAVDNNSSSARAWSDIIAYGAITAPLAVIVEPANLREGAQLTLLFTETMLINYGASSLIKAAARRPRPYLYAYALTNQDATVDAYGRRSFLSAHTSNTAAATFFFGRVFADYHPESKLRPYIWTLAAIVPAATGYLRIKAGEHFPTDVIAGYALGASVGYLVPALHRKPIADRRLSIAAAGNGIYISYSLE